MSTHSLPELEPGFHQFRHVIEGDLGFEVFVWRGETAGKTLLLNGATHGDEYEGPTFLSELARDWRPQQLSGTVVAIPVLHEAAFFAKTWPAFFPATLTVRRLSKSRMHLKTTLAPRPISTSIFTVPGLPTKSCPGPVIS